MITWDELLQRLMPDEAERGATLLQIETWILQSERPLAEAVEPFKYEVYCIALDKALAGTPDQPEIDREVALARFTGYLRTTFRRAAMKAQRKRISDRALFDDPSRQSECPEQMEQDRQDREKLLRKVEDTIAAWSAEDHTARLNLPSFAQFAVALGEDLLGFHRAAGFQFDQAALRREYMTRFHVEACDSQFVANLIATGLERLKRRLRARKDQPNEDAA